MSNETKGRLKVAVKRAAAHVPWPAGGDAETFRILTYHSVGERNDDMNVRLDDFRRQMAWLADNARVRPLTEWRDCPGGLAITFDDGFRDNLRNAAPITASHGFPATCFVVAGRMGTAFDGLDRTRGMLMTWDEVRTLETMGFAIGGHAWTHASLARLSEAVQREEIRACTQRIEDELQHGLDAFSYPFGSVLDFTETTKRIVREHGYRLAVSNRYGSNGRDADPFALRRIWIDRTDTFESFTAKVEGRLDVLTMLDSPAGIRARRFLNRVLAVT